MLGLRREVLPRPSLTSQKSCVPDLTPWEHIYPDTPRPTFCHTHHAQMTPKPVWFRRLREATKAAAVVIEDIDAGQNSGQNPGGPTQQQQMPWKGSRGPQSQPGQAQL